jgi:hypothetical protein
LDEVVWLGTHNSMSAASEPGWFFAEQLTGISQQLDGGVRALLIDTWYGYDTGGGVRTADRDIVESNLTEEAYGPEVAAAAARLAQFIGPIDPSEVPETYLCHAFCELGATPLVRALGAINRFMEQNPQEVIILVIQDQISPADTAKAFIASGLVKRVHPLASGQPLPTLRELIELDQRVIVLAENESEGMDWYLPAFGFIQETPFLARSAADFSCAPGRGSPLSPLFQMNHWISGGIPTMRDAEIVNQRDFILARVRECEQERGRRVNLVNVNFWEVGDALGAVNVLNGVEGDNEAANRER